MKRFAAVSLAMLVNACLVPNSKYFESEGEGFGGGEIWAETEGEDTGGQGTGGEDTEGEDTEGEDATGGQLCDVCEASTGGGGEEGSTSGVEEGSTGDEESSGGGGQSGLWLCEAVERPLLTHNRTQAGDVHVKIDADALIVTVSASDQWGLDKVQVYAGLDVPVKAPGQYTTSEDVDRGSFVVSFALEDIGAACGVPLHMAVHAELYGGSDASAYEGGVWALGPGAHEFERSWGGYFAADICCD